MRLDRRYRHWHQPYPHASEEGGDHLQAGRISEEQPIAFRQTMVAEQPSSDCMRAPDEATVAYPFALVATGIQE
jgi:hypothetical protein